jgi:PIN domain nuclease of toxin-antitoxin system
MTLLLDTCTFIWLCSAPEKLSGPASKALDSESNDRALSLATVWEITLKYHSGKLPLSEQPDRWIEEQLRLQDIDVCHCSARRFIAPARCRLFTKIPLIA